jgi:hypothetical protein
MKKKLLLMFIMLTTAFPVFADKTANAVDCGVLSEITRPLFHIIMIAAPILLIIMSAVDIFGVVSSSDEKNMQKCWQTMFKRFIICIIILILPLLINMVIGWTTLNDLTACL